MRWYVISKQRIREKYRDLKKSSFGLPEKETNRETWLSHKPSNLHWTILLLFYPFSYSGV